METKILLNEGPFHRFCGKLFSTGSLDVSNFSMNSVENWIPQNLCKPIWVEFGVPGVDEFTLMLHMKDKKVKIVLL